ncbi:hypothetical protein OH492_24505 [Vibrio chagasii]|nr:hypothetical protein [Vibrio chagasii]
MITNADTSATRKVPYQQNPVLRSARLGAWAPGQLISPPDNRDGFTTVLGDFSTNAIDQSLASSHFRTHPYCSPKNDRGYRWYVKQ